MDLLARREHGFHELVAKLSRKYTQSNRTLKSVSGRETVSADMPDDECPTVEPLSKDILQELIAQQVAILADENLQSDERFVESFVNGRKAQGKGPLRIRQELEQKQISDAVIAAYVDENEQAWQVLAEQVYIKKFGDGEAKSYQEKAKRFRFMQYRGFPTSALQSLVK